MFKEQEEEVLRDFEYEAWECGWPIQIGAIELYETLTAIIANANEESGQCFPTVAASESARQQQ